MKKFLLTLSVLAGLYNCLYASSLNIETEYRNRFLSYTNLDFDTSTSTDAISYSTQKLRICLNGIFDTGLPTFGEQIEICARLQALEIIGSSLTVPSFNWQNNLPYPRKDFIPFIEHSYVRISNLTRFPMNLIIGRQPLDYGSGVIISDNGIGYDALRLKFQYPKRYDFDILLNAKIKKGFSGGGDSDLSCLMISGPWKESNFKVGYFKEADQSGTIYSQGTNQTGTNIINRSFYDFILGKKVESKYYYSVELAFQQGEIVQQNGNTISLSGGSYRSFCGGVTSKRPNGATINYRLNICIASGDDDINSINDADESFSPSFGKKFDGLELGGYGTMLGLSPTTSLIDRNTQFYSGLGVINFGASYSPVYGFEYGFDAFMFSASEAGAAGGIFTGNFEKNILGAKYNLGNELNGYLKYSLSKYVDFKFSYARYTPPSFTSVWPKSQTCDMYFIETNCKF